MAYRQYTRCYEHVPGDEPFHESDLVGIVLGVAGPGLVISLTAMATGAIGFGAITFAITYAATILYVADQWLYHRLVCLSGGDARCALGVVREEPAVGNLGAFDNDEFFDLRLMPHRPGATTGEILGDGFQGQALLARRIADLPFDAEHGKWLHCEAEGNFWQAMKDTVVAQAILVGVGAAAGAIAGAAAGCAIGGIFGPIGCAIGAVIGAILGALLGAAAGAALGAWLAFESHPGDVEDANVGDRALGPIADGDEVVVYAVHVYDGFHEGWHELHPLMAVQKLDPTGGAPYLEEDPALQDGAPLPAGAQGLTQDDVRRGLDSPAFRARAEAIRREWCDLIGEAHGPLTVGEGQKPRHRWTAHPKVDGCT